MPPGRVRRPSRASHRSASSDPRTEHGELLWPERFGPKEIADLKEQPRQLRRGGPASAAALARRGWHVQAALVPILAATGRESSAGILCGCRTAPSARSSHTRCRNGRRAGSNPGIARSRIWRRRTTSSARYGAGCGSYFLLLRPGPRPHGLPGDGEGGSRAVREVAADATRN